MGQSQGKEEGRSHQPPGVKVAHHTPTKNTPKKEEQQQQQAETTPSSSTPKGEAETHTTTTTTTTTTTQPQKESDPGDETPSNISLRAVQATCGKGSGVATVIRWAAPENYNALDVMVEGTFTNWSKNPVKLRKSSSEWMALVYLQPGHHAYRFFVDGRKGVVDSTKPTLAHVKGEFNYLSVVDSITAIQSDDDDDTPTETNTDTKTYATASAAEKECYSQTQWVFEETRKLPPLFPPHLRFTPLTTNADVRPTQELELPIPYHVTINHMYFQGREGYNVVGGTFRHVDKYSTVVYYRAQEPVDEGAEQHQDPNAEMHSEMRSVPIIKPVDFF